MLEVVIDKVDGRSDVFAVNSLGHVEVVEGGALEVLTSQGRKRLYAAHVWGLAEVREKRGS